MDNVFTLRRSQNLVALFVNSDTPPDEKIPLHVYSYKDNHDRTTFFQLCLLKYSQVVDDVKVSHQMYDWEVVKIKPWCEKAAKQLIDSNTGIQEFLKETR